MTWKIKHVPAPQPRYSAREIATNLGIGAQEVMAALEALGEFVGSSAPRVVEEPVKRRVCEYLGLGYEPPPAPTPPPWERTGPESSAKRPANRGLPPEASPRVRHSETGIIRPVDRSVGLGDPAQDASDAMAEVAWNLHGFEEADRNAWLVHLRRGQAKLAAELRDAGFLPEDLTANIFGWTVAKRLRSGESMAEVKRLLDKSRRAS